MADKENVFDPPFFVEDESPGLLPDDQEFYEGQGENYGAIVREMDEALSIKFDDSILSAFQKANWDSNQTAEVMLEMARLGFQMIRMPWYVKNVGPDLKEAIESNRMDDVVPLLPNPLQVSMTRLVATRGVRGFAAISVIAMWIKRDRLLSSTFKWRERELSNTRRGYGRVITDDKEDDDEDKEDANDENPVPKG